MRAEDAGNFARPVIPFPNARTAFKAYMQALGLTSKDRVLLPAYLGWSKHEGSGVLDPIQEIGVGFTFYRITRELAVDLDDLRAKLAAEHVSLLVVIHYFGYPDQGLSEAVARARNLGVLVLEDEAHALYSDWVGGVCGRVGDVAIHSLLKLFPLRTGGLLQLAGSVGPELVRALKDSTLRRPLERELLDYDLLEISRVRCRNAAWLLKALQPLRPAIVPLRPRLPAGVVPQTLPVIVNGHSRDDLYFKLNAAGFGVVTLYHTLIDQILPEEYLDSHWLAKRILNLPVHQDVSARGLKAMVAELTRLL